MVTSTHSTALVFREIDDNQAELMQVAGLLFDIQDDWQDAIANRTTIYSGYHVAAFQGDVLIGYADCLADGSLLQSAGPDSLRRELEDKLLAESGLGGARDTQTAVQIIRRHPDVQVAHFTCGQCYSELCAEGEPSSAVVLTCPVCGGSIYVAAEAFE